MDELDLCLQALVQEACSHLPASAERRKALNHLLRAVQKSGRVWRGTGDLYEEALSQTMITVSQKLCEKYNPELGLFLPWFNACLRNQYRDQLRAAKCQRSHRRPPKLGYEENLPDPIEQIAAPIDVTPYLDTWESFLTWLEADVDGTLRACYIQGNPQANCQSLAYLRIFLGKEWQQIATELGLSRGAVTSHWCRRCEPLLRAWFDDNPRIFGDEDDER
jgi:DNA-directed RNA polymerase specialized sigma24 family protein